MAARLALPLALLLALQPAAAQQQGDAATDKASQNLRAPLIKDSFQLWERSWAVLRFTADRPGFWYFHCHETQHLMLGLQMVFNVRPSKQPAVPADVPTSGEHWCPTVHEAPWGS